MVPGSKKSRRVGVPNLTSLARKTESTILYVKLGLLYFVLTLGLFSYVGLFLNIFRFSSGALTRL